MRSPLVALLVIYLAAGLAALPAAAQTLRINRGDDYGFTNPGFGLIFGNGLTEKGTAEDFQNHKVTERFGFTTRRLSDNDRIGSLALIYEENTNGLTFDRLTDDIDGDGTDDEWKVRYQSIFAELKRYYPLMPHVLYYWGVRGGYSRVQGQAKLSGGGKRKFEADSFTPLALLAVPFVLEEPAFIVLALVDGTSAGVTLDIVPERFWFDFEISAVILPRYRDQRIVLDKLIEVTRTLQLVFVF